MACELTAGFQLDCKDTIGGIKAIYLQQFQASADFNLQFNGYDIYVCPGISNGTVIAAQDTNLFVGVDANSDFAEVKVVDMTLTDASDNVRMAMRFRVGVQVGVLGDVVYCYND